MVVRFLLYKSLVEIRCTLLGLMRTNLCASWAHNWSLGARILAVCLGVQILLIWFLLYKSLVEIRCTLLGLMRTNLCASWAHNWSLGARILAVCLGVQIL